MRETKDNSIVANGGWVEVKQASRPKTVACTIMSLLCVFPSLVAPWILSSRTGTGRSTVLIPNPHVDLRKLY
jgi:hypothetical protein